ncbi:hypothetical protein SAMN04488540_11499 [Ferrimonas sediminum]|uniref:Uncharacterized protein n=1 Tax=Ferrimonas sediminum TaxID=718193 RepID=A0A1G8X669_9GAMM|nr:hypothetical protein [Ferrimonas sediminum]SDJ86102.1 hypothetical protein SAMN04488540_11499 [Ferrimonas sediminum]
MSRWQLLFWGILLVAVMSLMALLLTPKTSFAHWCLLSISTLLIYPCFGFAYQVPIGALWMARLNAGLVIVSFAFMLLMGLFYTFENFDLLHIAEFIGMFAAILLLMHPPYQYAFRSPHLWKTKGIVVAF